MGTSNIAAALSLIDVSVLRRYVRVRRSTVVLSVIATVGVVLFGVLQGILVAVILSVLLFFRRSWWPHGEVLGQVDELGGWHSAERYEGSEQLPGVVVYRWETPVVLRELEHLPRPGPGPGARAGAPVGGAAVKRSPMSI